MNASVVILAAGQGTRMNSALPKVMHQSAGLPLIAWVTDTARALGGRTVVVLGHGKEVVEQLLRARYQDTVDIAVQSEQRGTGHAVQMALPALAHHTGTVLILYGDCPLITVEHAQQLVQLRESSGAPLALWTTQLADATGYGRIVRDGSGAFMRIVEHKDASAGERAISEVNPGVYAVDAVFLREAIAQLQPNNTQGELYLTDIVGWAVARGHAVPTLAVPAEETLGVNDRVQLAQASAVLRKRVIERAMKAGVTFEDPSGVMVDVTVRFGRDVIIGPHVSIRGASAVGDNTRISAGCVLVDTVVQNNVVMLPYSVCEGASIAADCAVGPFARLRPGAELMQGAHVGNFVELKKTRLGKGSKANHLAYLGDAVIGEGTNVGAGTITCNYDGFGKYVTAIGDNVFIGSNATLVAPLHIAEHAYVAAGSVVTHDVPAHALALGRARQETKAGYAQTIRARAKAQAELSKKPKA